MTKSKIVIASLLFSLCAAGQARAEFCMPALKEVPTERILKNLQGRLGQANNSSENKARIEFQIGRLHSMAYAQKMESTQVPADEKENSLHPWFGYQTDFNQFHVNKTDDARKNALAAEHLAQAVKHLRTSLQLDYYAPAEMGLAWCLDQAGEKKEALRLYRKIFAESADREIRQNGGMRGRSVGYECGGYLLNLLDPLKDADEIAQIKEKRTRLNEQFRGITPIVVPLKADTPIEQIMGAAALTFDLDGEGPRSYNQWPSKSAGWLVYAPEHKAQITSGLQLFGQSTFWVFWRDGYEALSALDDNNDGTISGAEGRGLAIWIDGNGNGISEAGEVKTLAQCRIESISCRGEFDAEGRLYSKNGVNFIDGTSAHSYDWILNPLSSQPRP